MSRLTDLIAQAKASDPQLGADLEAEFRALTRTRNFGLVFEKHKPEVVDLPQRPVRNGDKVRVLPPRGTVAEGDQRLWSVSRVERSGGDRIAHLVRLGDTEERRPVNVEDCLVVAEFRDLIYPGLVETGRVERGGDKPFHAVINAENFHALEALTYTHRGTVDAIYIDPPYNTGARDWKYNNDYVEGDDDYRHSKWLSFMERRLTLAKELLNPADSVLIVTIDEKEYRRLGLLLEQVFPEARVQMVTIAINHRGVARAREFTRVEEYAFYVFIGQAGPYATTDDLLSTDSTGQSQASLKVRWEWLIKGSNNARRVDRPNLFYPVYIDPARRCIAEVGEPIPLDVDRQSVREKAGLLAVWPISMQGEEKRWQVSPATLRSLVAGGMAKVGAYDRTNNRWSILYLNRGQRERIERGEIALIGRDSNGVLQLETHLRPLRAAMTMWNRAGHNAGYYGSGVLAALIPNRKFPFPKSLYAVEDSLRFAVAGKPDALILDFFAGSGTTAHAVMRLNRQDGGRRRSISVTNNEVAADEQRELRQQGLRPGDSEWEKHGICAYMTEPRIEAAITGRTPAGDPIKGDYRFVDEFPMAEGFGENAVFYTLTYETPISVSHHRAFAQVAPLLWLRAGSQGRVIDTLPDRGWDVGEAYGVLEDLDRAKEFVRAVAEVRSVRIAYIVTDDDRRFQMVCRELPASVLPLRLYESYLTNFEINSGRVVA